MDCYNSVWDYRYRNKDFVKKTAELLTDIGEFSIWMPRKEHDDVKLYDISGYYTFELDGGLSITLEYYITRKDESHIAVHLYITNHEKAFRKEFFIALGDNPLKMSAKPIKESWGRYKYINALSLSDSDIHITEQIASVVRNAYAVLSEIKPE